MSVKNRFAFSRKTIILTSIVVIALLVWLTVAIVHFQQNKTDDSTKTVEQPQFATVLPKGESINTLGGWSRVSPPSSDPVFAYNDTLNGVSINISQQPLPSSFEGNVDTKVGELAKQYSATRQITAESVKAYIGISSKGPQSVIFTKNNLLVLIKSQQKVDDKDWSKYIESLS